MPGTSELRRRGASSSTTNVDDQPADQPAEVPAERDARQSTSVSTRLSARIGIRPDWIRSMLRLRAITIAAPSRP